jgi:hypothetical protein
MASWVRNKGQPGRVEWQGELDLILNFMMSNDLVAAIAGTITTAAPECLATEDWRERSGAHTLANDRSQQLFIHKAPRFTIGKGPSTLPILPPRSLLTITTSD